MQLFPADPRRRPGGRAAALAAALAVLAGGSAHARASERPTTHELAIGNPLADARVHASHYALGPALLGWGAEELATRRPLLDAHGALRFTELSATVAVEVPWMVLSHELGHYRVARAHGWEARVRLTGWMSGSTELTRPPGTPATMGARLRINAAGLNQQQINARDIYRTWALAGALRYQETLAYLLAQTNLAVYAGYSLTLAAPPSADDDVAAYLDLLARSGHEVSGERLFAVALAADLLSAPLWAALAGGARFLVSGERRVPMPAIEAGGTRTTLPSFTVVLSSAGPVLGFTTFVQRGGIALELEGALRHDCRAATVGVRLHGLPLAAHLRLSPRLRLGYDRDRGLGYRVGAAVTTTGARVGLRAGVEYSHGDFAADVAGRGNGLHGEVGILVAF